MSEPLRLNHTYLTAVAVGGPFLRGYTLMVEPRSPPIREVGHPRGSLTIQSRDLPLSNTEEGNQQ